MSMPKVPTLVKGNLFVDDRGALSFVNGFDFEGVKRFYQVENHGTRFVRAWHGHKKEGKYVYVAQGAAKICAVDMGRVELVRESPESGYTYDIHSFTISGGAPSVLWIPPGYYNGFMNLSPSTMMLFFSTATVEESKEDDYRLEWNELRTDVWEEHFR